MYIFLAVGVVLTCNDSTTAPTLSSSLESIPENVLLEKRFKIKVTRQCCRD